MRVGLYLRLSEETDGKGLERQRADCEALAAKRGWEVGQTYVDPDNSAYKRKPRPAFEQLLRDLASGQIEGLVSYDLDRIARRPSDLERIIDLYDTRPLVFGTCQGELDLGTSDGRTMARVLVAFSNKASADTSRRVLRKHRELRLTGVPAGGNRPFGWKADRRTLDPIEAELIRTAAKDLLAGVGMHTICRRWNDAGIKTTTGNLWQKPVFRNMMLSPRLAGFRVYQKKKALDDNGEPVRGLFESVLDEDTWEAVCAFLTAPERSGNHVHVGGRKYLLSGIVRCAVCSKPLSGNAVKLYSSFMYACKIPSSGGCGKVAITGPRVDELITELVLRYLAQREVTPTRESWTGEAQLVSIMERIRELMDAYTKGTLSGDVVFPAVSKLEGQSVTLRDERADWLRGQISVLNRPTNVPEAWPNLELEQQRDIIASLLHAVVVKPATKGGPKFYADRVSVVWR